MTTYVIDAEDNYPEGESAAIFADNFPYIGITTNIQFSTAFDPTRNLIFYSQCWVDTSPPPDPTTTPGVWTGLVGFAPGASYNPEGYKNFAILTKNVESGVVTMYDAYDPTSLVPNGIGGSDGTYVRFVSSTASNQQGLKVTDPRTGNVWCHNTGGSPQDCTIYEFRLEDSYGLTISPFVSLTLGHIEIFGISDDWVLVGCFEEITANRYNLNWIPRERQADEITADYLLSYGTAPMAASLDGIGNTPIRSCIDLDGNCWFAYAARGAGARDYRLVKATPPTSGVVNPATGQTCVDVTPWGGSDGPNTDATNYTRSSVLTTNNGFILRNQISIYCVHSLDRLVFINRLYPVQITPSGSTDPLDLKFQATFIDRNTLAYSFKGSFITGYMTAGWAMTTDPMAAAYAVLDMQEMDLYRDFNGYDYSGAGVNDTLRWFAVTVAPVEAGVVGSSTTYRFVLAQYDFSGASPSLVRFFDEATTWDPQYPDYATAIGNDRIIYRTTLGNTSSLVLVIGDTGISLANSFWFSGLSGRDFSSEDLFDSFEAYYNNRPDAPDYPVTAPFMELTWTPSPSSAGAGYTYIRYRQR